MLESQSYDASSFTRALLDSLYDPDRKFRAVEHPDFGGVTAVHSPNSWHYNKAAVDLQDWRDDLFPEFPGGTPIGWKQRKSNMLARMREHGGFVELLGPGDPNHDAHLHVAIDPQRPLNLRKSDLDYIATGRWQDPEGNFRFVAPEGFGTLSSSSSPMPRKVDVPTGDFRSEFKMINPGPNPGVAALQGLMSSVLSGRQSLSQALGLPSESYDFDVPSGTQQVIDALGVGLPQATLKTQDRGALNGVRMMPQKKDVTAAVRKARALRNWEDYGQA